MSACAFVCLSVLFCSVFLPACIPCLLPPFFFCMSVCLTACPPICLLAVHFLSSYQPDYHACPQPCLSVHLFGGLSICLLVLCLPSILPTMSVLTTLFLPDRLLASCLSLCFMSSFQTAFLSYPQPRLLSDCLLFRLL